MVRNLVGTMLDVGRGYMASKTFPQFSPPAPALPLVPPLPPVASSCIRSNIERSSKQFQVP